MAAQVLSQTAHPRPPGPLLQDKGPGREGFLRKGAPSGKGADLLQPQGQVSQALLLEGFQQGFPLLPQFIRGDGEHPQCGVFQEGLLRIQILHEGSLQGGEGQLIHPQGPEELVFADLGQELLLSGDDPPLGAAQELIPTEGDQVYPSLQKLPDARFLDAIGLQVQEGTASQVIVEGDPGFPGHRGQLFRSYAFGEA